MKTDKQFDIEGNASAVITHRSHEIIGLCKTLNYNISEIYSQNLQKPNPTYYIGRGKAQEISEFISEDNTTEFAVFDCQLKPNQSFNLENKLRVRVIDRSTLILMIFLHHSRTKEAKLQIEYAILNHQLPYVKELVRRTKLGEHAGLMAGGEYKVDEYYRLARTRVKLIRHDLAKMKTSRTQQRKHRRKKGFTLISLAGYTNAGKSSLLRALTKADVPVDDNMFSTVSPRTRRFRNTTVLFTDTVGFIQNIPTQLIEAFKSTLEEITDADRIMLVADISENIIEVKKKLNTCLTTINQLLTERSVNLKNSSGINGTSGLNLPDQNRPKFHLVFNKSDIESDNRKKMRIILDYLSEELPVFDFVSVSLISCKTRTGIDELIKKLSNFGSDIVSV
jgi:GTP-binding protein HflX